jgi:hypothetical protein
MKTVELSYELKIVHSKFSNQTAALIAARNTVAANEVSHIPVASKDELNGGIISRLGFTKQLLVVQYCGKFLLRRY